MENQKTGKPEDKSPENSGRGAKTPVRKADSRKRGKWGEEIAARYLVDKGFIIVDRCYHSRFGEIDIIAKDRDYLAFVEVKLRKNASFAYAREYVGKEKQWKITATAEIWLSLHKTMLQPRFDVIEIYAADETAAPEIIHIENAF